jgi:hypothetical protein
LKNKGFFFWGLIYPYFHPYSAMRLPDTAGNSLVRMRQRGKGEQVRNSTASSLWGGEMFGAGLSLAHRAECQSWSGFASIGAGRVNAICLAQNGGSWPFLTMDVGRNDRIVHL